MSKLNALQILLRTRDLLSHPGRWTKQAWARDFLGNGLDDPNDRKACCWCVSGALDLVGLPETGKFEIGAFAEYDKAYKYLADVTEIYGDKYPFRSLPAFNDAPETDHKRLMHVFDLAIEAARKDLR